VKLGIEREDLVEAAMDLSPDYIVTRCPNIAGEVPEQLYSEGIARDHLEKARLIIGY